MQNKYSDLKLVHFPAKLASFRSGEVTAPIYVRVKPINVCNHSCWWCCYHSPDLSQMHTEMANKDILPTAKMMEILDDFHSMGVKAVTFSGGGEPLLHRDIVTIMERVLELGIDLSIITNGSMLKGAKAEVLAKAKWVRISMDYSCREQLAEFRRVHESAYDEIMANVEAFSKLDGSCDLYVNYIVHDRNCSNLVEVARTLKDIGVHNVRFSPMWISPGFHDYHAKLVDSVQGQLGQIQAELVSGRFTVNTSYDLTSSAHNSFRTYHKCFFMQTVPVIGADQVVYACHNKAYDSTGAIGSIRNQRFSELWFSPEAKQFMDGLDPVKTCCHQCANDSKNQLVNEIVNASFDNFV